MCYIYFTRDQFAFAYEEFAARKKAPLATELPSELQALKKVKLKTAAESQSATPGGIVIEPKSGTLPQHSTEAKETESSSTQHTKLLLEVKKKLKK